MANGVGSVLSRIGQGALAFGSGKSVSEIDTIRSNRDVAAQNVQLSEQSVQLGEQDIEANQRALDKDQRRQILVNEAFGGGPESAAAMAKFAIEFPEELQQISTSSGIVTQGQKNEAADFATRLKATPFDQRQPLIDKRVAELSAVGRDAQHTASLTGQTEEDQNSAASVFEVLAMTPEQRFDAATTGTQLGQAERGLDIQEQRVTAEIASSAAIAGLKVEERETKAVQAALKTEEGFRKEVNTLLKDFFQVSDANARIKAAGENPSAAGDLALIFNFMKMLDPGSTVREGEFATAEQSAGIPARIVGLYNKIVTGERLPPEQRKDFLNRADQLFDAAIGEATKTAESFEQIALSAGVNVGNVLATFQQRSAGADGAGAPEDTPTGGGAVVRFDKQGNRL